MEKINACEFSELLTHAQKEFGIHWNAAHEMLVDGDVCEGNVYVDDIESCWEGQEMPMSVKIVLSFAKKHGVTEFYILPKN